MKIIYMGTPDFAAVPLEALVKAGHEIGYVVSQPDKAKNRGKKVQPTPVKEIAIKYGLEVLQPEKLKDNTELLEIFKQYEADIVVVAAYGRIIPEEYLNLAKYGIVNIHGSLLPKYRGASPVQAAILAGDEETGVTLMYVEKGLDTGDMIAKATVKIESKNCEELMKELSQVGAELLISELDDIENWKSKAVKQDDSIATHTGIISKKDGEIDFNKSPKTIECAIRGLDPWPGAYTYLDGEPFKIWGAEVLDGVNNAEAGTITGVSQKGIEISAGGSTLLATIVQVPGKKRMPAADFLRGYSLEIGRKFGL